MQGMLSNLPPGMAGFVLADQQRGQKTAQNIQSLGMLSQLQNADLERQLLPLKMKQLQAQVAEAETMGGILRRYMEARGGQAGVPAGGTQVGMTPGTPGQPAGNAFALPPDVELALLHPRLAGLGKVQAEAYKPTDKVREAVALGMVPGSPQFNAFIGTQFNQGGAWQTSPQGGVNLAPGYAQGMGEVKRAEEGAKAGFDLVTVPPTSPNAPPTFRSRAQVLQGAGAAPVPPPVTTTAPTDAEALRIVQEASRNGGHATVTVPGANAPTAPIPSSAVIGNAAGISPAQEADVKATAAFKLKTAEDYSKLYGELNNSSMRLPPKIAKFERVGQLLGELEGGKLSPAGFELARLGNSLGLKLDPNLSNKEAAAALSNEIALELRGTGEGGGMPGALSDADREFLKSMTPQMASTAEGRKQIIQSRTSVWRREIDVAGMARKYVKKYGRLDEDFFSQLSEWSSRNPIFK
jgi:hypothetical protein